MAKLRDFIMTLIGRREIQSGTYSPSIMEVYNIGTSRNASGNWIRIGDFVHVSGLVTIGATAGGGTPSRLRLSLPVPTLITFNLKGVCAAQGDSGSGTVSSDGALEGAALMWDAMNTSVSIFGFSFTYEIHEGLRRWVRPSWCGSP